MSSVYVVCWIFLQTFQTYFTYRQTVWTQIILLLEEQSDLGPHCLQKWLSKSQADVKADDSCRVNRYHWKRIMFSTPPVRRQKVVHVSQEDEPLIYF